MIIFHYLGKFLAPRCSCAYFFCLLTVAVGIIVPFIAAFGTGSFWLKLQVYIFKNIFSTKKYMIFWQFSANISIFCFQRYHEQPTVKFAHEYFLMLDGKSDTSSKLYGCQQIRFGWKTIQYPSDLLDFDEIFRYLLFVKLFFCLIIKAGCGVRFRQRTKCMDPPPTQQSRGNYRTI